MRSLKTYVKRIPILGRIALGISRTVRTGGRNFWRNSSEYWEMRYCDGGTSGAGSYGEAAAFKAEVLNDFVANNEIYSVIEFGCGDGNQLSLIDYPSYTGFDVSKSAIEICNKSFSNDKTKRFCLIDDYNGEVADLSLSLDVIYHLIEDKVFDDHMNLLFGSSKRFVIIYSSNFEDYVNESAAHVRNRRFTDWIDKYCPNWELRQIIPNKSGENEESSVRFYIYEKQFDMC